MNHLEAAEAQRYLLRLEEIAQGSESVKVRLLLLRQLLEAIYKALSGQSKTSFNGLFARMQYVNEELQLPEHLSSQLNRMRIVCNSVAHDEFPDPSSDLLFSGILALNSILKHLYPDIQSETVEGYLSRNQAKSFTQKKHSPKQSFKCVVLAWDIWKGGGADRALQITVCDEEGIENSLLLYCDGSEGRQWSLLARSLWKYATLACINLTVAKGRQNSFISNPSSLIVLEPDFLIDASALAECFTRDSYKPEYYVVNRLVKESSSDKMLQGMFVNAILDDLILDPELDFDTLYRRALAQQPISLVALGINQVQAIETTIRDTHYHKVREFAQTLKDEEVLLEPSFVCPEFGLQGRLDLIYQKNGTPHIVELKSGKAPAYDVWKGHQMQVTGYNLIIRNCYARSASGSSSIFYSSAAENNLRHVVNTVAIEQSLLMCRNRVVGIMRQLAVDPSSFFHWLIHQRKNHDEGFVSRKIEEVTNTLKNLDDYEYEWFLEQIRLAVSEIWSVKTGGLNPESIYGHNALWQQSIVQKQQRYRILDTLQALSVDQNRIRFSLSNQSGITDFRLNDIVVLYRQSDPVTRQEILRGVITFLSNSEVEVTVRGGLRLSARLLQNDSWALEHDVLESSLYNPLSSVFSFLRAPKRLRNLYLGLVPSEYQELPDTGSDDIAQVVARMRSAKDYYVVQGPPGTGKTSGLLTAYLVDLYTNTQKNVFILSFTNRAVDEICLCLKRKSVPFIRTGTSEEVSDQLLNNIIAGKPFDEIEQVLKTNRVWVATVQSCNAWLNDFTLISQVDELIIDEASQIVENSILGILAKAGKAILIGDQNQLPPITLQTNNSFSFRHEKLDCLCYSTYNQSMMERLYRVCVRNKWEHSRSMLFRHYRMHSEIAQLVQPYYQGRLLPMKDRQHEPLPPTQIPLLSSRLVWIECPPSLHANYDPRQVETIKKLLDLLEREGLIADFEKDIGIVSPFRAMIHALRQELNIRQQQITIDTVERFQGSERDIIVITLPLRNSEALRTVEALSSDGSVDRKLNVALSRAKQRIFILGNGELCSRSAHYAFLMDRIRSCGIMLSNNEI